MPKGLKPCPHCGSKCLNVDRNILEHYQVMCTDCGMCGPWLENRKSAVTAWNTLPRAPHITPNDTDCKGCPERQSQVLVWTKEPPTVPGRYWYIQRGSYIPCIVQLVYLDFDTDRLKASFVGIEDDEYVEDMDGWWAGPIPIPEEAE